MGGGLAWRTGAFCTFDEAASIPSRGCDVLVYLPFENGCEPDNPDGAWHNLYYRPNGKLRVGDTSFDTFADARNSAKSKTYAMTVFRYYPWISEERCKAVAGECRMQGCDPARLSGDVLGAWKNVYRSGGPEKLRFGAHWYDAPEGAVNASQANSMPHDAAVWVLDPSAAEDSLAADLLDDGYWANLYKNSDGTLRWGSFLYPDAQEAREYNQANPDYFRTVFVPTPKPDPQPKSSLTPFIRDAWFSAFAVAVESTNPSPTAEPDPQPKSDEFALSAGPGPMTDPQPKSEPAPTPEADWPRLAARIWADQDPVATKDSPRRPLDESGRWVNIYKRCRDGRLSVGAVTFDSRDEAQACAEVRGPHRQFLHSVFVPTGWSPL
jgi:hypothetical protein